MEQRPYEVISYNPRPSGRSSYDLRCPFCERIVECFAWSLAGSGKRCSCGAAFGPIHGGTSTRAKEQP